jgi:two-component sensor histidine kinase
VPRAYSESNACPKDGIGFPEHLDFRSTESLGLQLVVTLADQVGASIELDRSGGTTFTIVFDERARS